jgi:hypothetical protein
VDRRGVHESRRVLSPAEGLALRAMPVAVHNYADEITLVHFMRQALAERFLDCPFMIIIEQQQR